ncbi:CRP-like cAMP-binding protein [Pedobacter sp. AK013]|uniref:Crp/Fnr family transcriptional regulator n=1 Tax=Pedobacter sp. AK013 TaxID=2723071 RepID=UPI00160934A0|nr:Crp/Fnr family transcriptional regulator [Pedobacter sp. AK013]MBB6237533.1 CRP-like cAMP-binding protein [Pedobacter sp. AK013]
MEEENYFKKITDHLKPSVGLKNYLRYVLQKRAFKKKQTIAVTDPYFSTLLFIGTGTLRLYAIREEEETTILFWQKNQFLTPMFMLGNYLEKEVYVEFLEDTTLIGYRQTHTANLYKLFPEYREIINRLYQQQLAALMRHAEALAYLNTSTRFENLMKAKPELFTLCRLKIIADYLGIHPKVLSLLRSKAVKKQ